jgi:hypothetical protein
MSAEDLARMVLAANDGISLHSLLDGGQPIYRSFLKLVLSNIVAHDRH